MDEPRTAEQFAQLMDEVKAACGVFWVIAAPVGDEDLAAAIATVQRAEDFGALVDPTAYRVRIEDGGLARQKRLLTAFRAFRTELAAIFPGTPR